MKHILLTLISVSYILHISAQEQNFTLHPIIGDTIQLEEVSKYLLFNDHELGNFDYLILTKSDSTYFINSYKQDIKLSNIPIKKKEIQLQQSNIEKLNKYFLTITKKDSISNYIILKDSVSAQELNLEIMTPELLRDIKKSNKRKHWSDYRNQCRKNRKNGMVY